MRHSTIFKAVAASGLGSLLSGAAFAQGLEVVGQPLPQKMGFQPAATELARDLQGLDHMILIIITVITIFVTGLLIWVMIRYNTKANKTPATFTHNSPLEVAWTVIPILILVFIGAFSLPVLFKQQEIPTADITIKVIGNQWYWSYEYTDNGVTEDAEAEPIAFDSFMLAREDLAAHGYEDSAYLLATDTAVVVPVGKTIVMNVTAADVIHSWKIPAFGVMQDAVPGRLAQLWFSAEREGIYFGQCSELCGKDHAYMPITVKVVSEDVYAAWVAKAEAGDVMLSAADLAQPVELASN
ncbi:cytochrome c oxidase subunit II [Fuscovulum ytuae]|uniref:Cytochrome c oxidase subunit 2 n=1 Tax=Fuscovulum ytuae TaxID=3042299 RepID=A0ABY8Q6P3_9RHOB|nr:cytochrome c oxidase subunit II [Fuscovulum sp. YMD61]WGV16516.1 cytochrome c oxidase subunit II [Fuscovulum sp. YMD61]